MALGRVNGVAASTGFSYKKMYGRLGGTKKGNYKGDRINEVTVWRGSTVQVA